MRAHYEYRGGEVIYAVEDGVVVIDKRDQSQSNKKSFQVMPDIQPYKSMIDGTMITSRSKHRQHLKDHGCVEIGNDSSLKARPKPLQSPPGLKDEIIRAVHQVEQRRR